MAEIRCRKPEALEGQPEGESRCKLVRAAEHSAYFLFSVLTLSPEQLCLCSSVSFLQYLLRMFFGFLAAVACGMLYAGHLSGYHDRKFWFSTRQVGDSIFLCFPSKGMSWFYELMVDNRTISGQTINAVERLFLYPELITSFIYRITNSQVRRSSVCLCFTLSENCFIIMCN
ncbi:hypothetical protein XENOCAPTIV_026188 [Xenoophorus captivus]|uniref:Uncharacterized protein n=1 Tax=Xenoophorus captivus TaxID=1517983 RepID=A0ABV0QBJ8_9TELE